MANEWVQYGLLESPFKDLNDKVYKDQKKVDLYTDTKKYIGDRNTYLQGIPDKVNNAFKAVFTDETLKKIPLKTRQQIAKQIGEATYNEHMKILNTLYPDAKDALVNQNKLNISKAVVEGDAPLKIKKPRKKKGDDLQIDIININDKKEKKEKKVKKEKKGKKERKGKK